MLPFMKSKISKFSSDNDDLLALKISFAVENKRSTVALEGISVLYSINKSIKICSPRKAPSAETSLELLSSQF